MLNADIKKTAQESGVRLWEVAERLGIADSTFSRKLRHELPDAEKQRIFAIIDDIVSQQNLMAKR